MFIKCYNVSAGQTPGNQVSRFVKQTMQIENRSDYTGTIVKWSGIFIRLIKNDIGLSGYLE